jgi:PADRE domain
MGNSLRCFVACVLPFGAFDLIRVVHLSGQIEEYSAPITVRQILAIHPNYILTKPSAEQGVSRWIAILSHDTELKRGHIYFLVPSNSASEKNVKQAMRMRKHGTVLAGIVKGASVSLDLERDNKVGQGHHRRTSSRLSDWKPNLECISEDL